MCKLNNLIVLFSVILFSGTSFASGGAGKICEAEHELFKDMIVSSDNDQILYNCPGDCTTFNEGTDYTIVKEYIADAESICLSETGVKYSYNVSDYRLIVTFKNRAFQGSINFKCHEWYDGIPASITCQN